MILIKREEPDGGGVAGSCPAPDTTSVTPPEFVTTVFPDSSSGQKSSSTMWEDIGKLNF